MTRPSILLVSRWLPAPADNGARIRRSQLVAALAEHFDVDYLALLDAPPSSDDVAAVPARVHVVEQPPFDPRSWRARRAWWSRTPRAVIVTRSAVADELVARLVHERRPVAIVADEIHTAHYAIGHGVPVVLEELQLAHLAEDRRLRARLTWWKNRAHHRRVLAAVTMATAPSELEAARARAIAPSARVEVLPNGVDLTRLTPDPGAAVDLATLISAGSPTYAPNLDAAIWFGREVLPRVRARVPGARLVVTGERGGSTLPDIPGVEWVGRLDDVADAVRAAGCSVVALRAGGGTRVKILESLALGTPVVSTSKGAEGLGLVAGAELEVADDAAGFADAVVTVVTDPARRAELAAAGRAAAEARDWAPIRARWAELVAEVTVTDR